MALSRQRKVVESPRFASAVYLRIRQCLLKFLNSCFGNIRAAEVQDLELGQAVKLLQARIGELRIGEIQSLQLGQPLEMSDARVGYFGAQSEVEVFEISQPF
jgi:hypothetical protein